MSDFEIVDEDSLEEGEIPDDGADDDVVILEETCHKSVSKIIPHRYINLKSKTPKRQRKRNCKYKGNKQKDGHQDKSSPVSNTTNKIHKPSCSRKPNQFHNTPAKPPVIKNGQNKSIKSNHVNGNFKSAFKNYSSPPRVPNNVKKASPNNVRSKPHSEECEVDEFSKLLEHYKNYRKDSNHKGSKFQSPKRPDEHKSTREKVVTAPHSENKNLSYFPSVHSAVKQKQIENKENENEISCKEFENDSEEDLRRIALATCAKFKNTPVYDKDVIPVDMPSLPYVNQVNQQQQPHVNELVVNPEGSSDNYEVLDMDIDPEDCTEKYQDLFVIDRNPNGFSEFNQLHVDNLFDVKADSRANCHSNATSSQILQQNTNQITSNEEFDEELLRAQLIASITSKKAPTVNPAPQKIDEKVNEDVIANENKTIPTVKRKQNLTPFKKMFKSCMQNKKHLRNQALVLSRNALTLTRKINVPKMPNKTQLNFTTRTLSNNVNKRVNLLKMPNKKLPIRTVNYNANFKKPVTSAVVPGNVSPSKRFIITINNDSTTEEESEEECETKVDVKGIEALISDARKKSDEVQGKSKDLNMLSCLSKAQQEEYNSLKKILAEKDPLYSQSNFTNHHESILKKLETRLSEAKKFLNEEKEKMDNFEKELLKKKQTYLASKLKAQHLREQLHAAEKVRALHLEAWKNCTAKVDVSKKSISDLETSIKSLEAQLDGKRIENQNFMQT